VSQSRNTIEYSRIAGMRCQVVASHLVVSQQTHCIVAGGKDRIKHCLFRVEERVLRKVSNDAVVRNGDTAFLWAFESRRYAKEGRLAGAIQSYEANFFAIVDAKRHALK
jgi:hypothetical protein